MVLNLSQITGLGPYIVKAEPEPGHDNSEKLSGSALRPTYKQRIIYQKADKAFLILHQNTVEVRTDPKLAKHLQEKYESVMESRYFGRGGIEIVLADQLNQSELEDLIRLSYSLTP